MNASSCFYLAGYLVGAIAFAAMAWRRKLLTEGVFILMAAGLLGGLAGASLAQRIVSGSPGKTVLGAIVCGYFCVFAAKRVLGIKRPLGDLFAIGLSAGEAVGRLGCFFGGCCFGKLCSLPWAVHQHGAFRHPTQLYLAVSNLAILIVLICVERFKPPENRLFYLQGALYCTVRFTIEFFRDSPSTSFGLTSAQYACLFGFVFFSVKFAQLFHGRKVSL